MKDSKRERVIGWMECDNEFLNFKAIRVCDRLHPSRTLCGYLKLAELMRTPAKFECRSEHDVNYLCDLDDIRDEVTEADAVYLKRCGIHFDNEFECFADFT